jgi:TP901 family phage tail tape measure protein
VAADNEEVIFTGNASQLVAELNRIAESLQGMNGLLGKSDSELQAFESVTQRLAGSLRTLSDGMVSSGNAAEVAASKYGKYSAEITVITDKLAVLQAQQDRVNARQVIATGVPSSLGNGRGEQSIANTSTANLERIVEENKLLNTTLAQQAQEELNLRAAITSETEARNLSVAADERAVQVTRAEYEARIIQISVMEQVARAQEVEVIQARILLEENTRLAESLYNLGIFEKDVAVQAARTADALAVQAAATKASEAAARAAVVAHSQFVNTISNARYALYDASNTLATYSAALLALPILTALVAASYQRDFANVQRAAALTGDQSVKLKQQLIDLTTQIPLSFKAITEISTLGSQLGIDPSGLKEFTTVVAKLEATTNLSADAAGTLLGKFATIGGVAPAQFGALASAVLNVGVNTASTETQIAKLGTQIVGVAGNAGLTTPQIIGLAGALASVSSSGVELSRGAITQFFGIVGRAVANTTPALKIFADTAGVTSEQVKAAYGTATFAPLFQKFVDGLNGVKEAGGSVEGVLRSMGITSIRYIPLLLQLANGHNTLALSMKLAEDGYNSGVGVLEQHYLPIQKTLIAQTTELVNKFLALANQIGATTTGPLTDLVQLTGHLIDQFAAFAKTDLGQHLLTLSGFVLVLLGSLALLGAAVTRIAGGFAGLFTAGSRIAEFFAGITGGAATSAVGLTTMAAAEDVAAVSTVGLTAKLGALLAGIGLIGSLAILGPGFIPDTVSGAGAVPLIAQAPKNTNKNGTLNDAGVKAVANNLSAEANFGITTAPTKEQYAEAEKLAANYAKSIGKYSETAYGAREAAAKQVATSIELDKKVQVEQDKINKAFDGGLKGAEKLVAEYQKSIAPLTSMNAIIGEIQGENSKKAQETPKAPAYDGYSVSLDQYTKKLTENTAKGNEWLANIKTIGADLGGPVAAQFISAGYTVVNGSILSQLIKATPAQRAAYVQATSESITLASQAAADALIVAGHLVESNGGVIGKETAASIADALTIGFSPADIVKNFNLKFSQNPLTPIVDINPALKALGVLQNSITTGGIVVTPGANAGRRGYRDGGYTGPGSKYEFAGDVHKGEYVTPAQDVNQVTGKPYWMEQMNLNASGRQQSQSFANGGYGGPIASSTAPIVVKLDPYTTRLLERAGNVTLMLDGKEVAHATNVGNFVSAKRSNN